MGVLYNHRNKPKPSRKAERQEAMRQYMIELIRKYQYFAEGALEALDDKELKNLYDAVIDWLG